MLRCALLLGRPGKALASRVTPSRRRQRGGGCRSRSRPPLPAVALLVSRRQSWLAAWPPRGGVTKFGEPTHSGQCSLAAGSPGVTAAARGGGLVAHREPDRRPPHLPHLPPSPPFLAWPCVL